MSIFLDTVNCIVCGKESWLHTGHVLDKDEAIIAGFCSYDCFDSIKQREDGYYGEYKKEMGKQERIW